MTYKKVAKFIKPILGFCPLCRKWFKYPRRRRRQNTAYVVEEENYITCCKGCFEMVQEHWNALWSEYYSSISGHLR